MNRKVYRIGGGPRGEETYVAQSPYRTVQQTEVWSHSQFDIAALVFGAVAGLETINVEDTAIIAAEDVLLLDLSRATRDIEKVQVLFDQGEGTVLDHGAFRDVKVAGQRKAENVGVDVDERILITHRTPTDALKKATGIDDGEHLERDHLKWARTMILWPEASSLPARSCPIL